MTAVLGLALVVGGSGSTAAPRTDFAAVALNILAPGQSGDLNLTRNSNDQLRLYDALTPRGAAVGTNLRRYFKPAWFGLRGTRAVKTVRPRPGVKIVRDSWGVPHVEGRTDADVAFGAGWATAEDRGLVLQLIRGPGRLAALDAPGINPLAILGRPFTPSPATEAFLAEQTRLLRASGSRGRETLRGIDAYAAGINAYFRSKGIQGNPWTRNDTYASAALIASQFGRGGGDEARRSELLSALQRELGAGRGRDVWEDLREHQDEDAPVSVPRRFVYAAQPVIETGNAVLDDGSFRPVGTGQAAVPGSMSNGLLVSARRSATGHPIFVSGPQVGFSYPSFFTELDLHGGGIDARGISFPGTFGVVIGRGKDFVWSAQSSHSDVIDQYVETLCGGDTHYVFGGSCREMGTFDAGTLGTSRVSFRTTVHGPVVGYATVGGRRVALSSKRSTRGREILSSFAFQDLNRNRVRSARGFLRAMNQVEFSFNWVYADHRDIAFFSAGRLPLRPNNVNNGLPTIGTGEHEWRGFVPQRGHPQAVNPPAGWIAAWNNRPAHGYAAPDDTWSWGAIQRVDLLRAGLAARRRHTVASVVGVMNKAATQDLRVVRVWPAIAAVMRAGTAPSTLAQQLFDLIEAWRRNGGSRLDRDLDGEIDDPGAASMDAAWPKLADAVLRPMLGPLLPRLAALQRRDDAANNQGSAYDSGWYGYVYKDLRRVAGARVKHPFRVRYCGGGDAAACRTSLWAALEEAGEELIASCGSVPARCRADARAERITFSGGILRETMRFANRPTFQQVMTFRKHR